MTCNARNWGGSQPASRQIICKGSTVQPSQMIVVNEFKHAGTVTHRCTLEESEHTTCRCDCGATWLKNFKGVRP